MSPEQNCAMNNNETLTKNADKDSVSRKFDEVDVRAINTIRVLSAEMVQAANSGHPGAPMGCAPLAHVLFSRHLRCNPANPKWINRDRFVLSNGHACALQYSLLHLLGYDLTLEDLKRFRQLDSKTPGHPENHMTPGIEVTTGPLGQGFANAVGLAVAQAHLKARFSETGLFDSFTFVLMGDGCMQEGVASEAASLAGHLKLGNLIVFYDDNNISIDGGTDISFTENVDERFKAYGFHCLSVENGDEDLNAIDAAICTAKSVQDRPTLIRIRTTIGHGSLIAGSEKAHGAPLGKDELARVKSSFGFDPSESFVIPSQVSQLYEQVAKRGAASEASWNDKLNGPIRTEFPGEFSEITRRFGNEHQLPEDFVSLLPLYEASESNQIATRKLSETLLNSLAPHLPELMGGSADLTASNLTKWKGSEDFQAPCTGLGSYAGRYIRFGVREHAMFAMMNGIAAFGGFIPMGATFLNFITYGWGALRLAALSHLPGLYIMTHDSIGLGEDGPTHQPIETLSALRALPNCICIRPADGNEVSGAYLAALTLARNRPAVLCLSRQNLPQLQGSSRDSTLRGAYILKDFDSPTDQANGPIKAIIIATGSEVSIAKETIDMLAGQCDVRLVSMPCCELFREQTENYKRSILPQRIPVISIEAAATQGWLEWAHHPIGIDSFGASGPYKKVYEKFGLVPSLLSEKVLKIAEHHRHHATPELPCFSKF